MAVNVTTWVFDHSKSKLGARLVLLAMADEAASTGELHAYRRSQSWIATKCNMSIRGVRDAIDVLVGLGELQVLSEGIGRTKSDYLILMGEEAASALDRQQLPLREEAASAPSPRSLPKEPISLVASTCDETFEKFWKAYPRRTGTSKLKARSAFKSALKKGHLEEIKEGFKRDTAMWASERRAMEHIPHAATWLNQERYMPEENGGGVLSHSRAGMLLYRADGTAVRINEDGSETEVEA